MQVSAINNNYQVSYTGRKPRIPNGIKQKAKAIFDEATQQVKSNQFFQRAKNFVLGIGKAVKDFAIKIWNIVKDFVVNIFTKKPAQPIK